MTHHVVDADLRVTHAGNDSGSADFVVRAEDLLNVQIDEKLGTQVDTGSMLIASDGGRYAGVAQDGLAWNEGGWNEGGFGGDFEARFLPGDKIDFRTQLAGENSLSTTWTGVITDPPTYQVGAGGANIDVELNIADFTTWICSERRHYGVYVDRPIAGSANAILDTVLAAECPEIDRSQIATVSETTTMEIDGRSVLEVVTDLADRADAVIGHDGTALTFDPLDTLSSEFTVTADDHTTFSLGGAGGDLKNAVRVDGGRDQAVEARAEQTTQDGTTTVTESSRLTYQFPMRKSEITKLELYTVATGSGETVQVRIQNNDSGSPVDAGDTDSDVVNKSLEPDDEDFTDGGYSTFRFADNDLPEPNPWLIVQTDGATGQDIGIRTSDGAPTFRPFFPFPVAIEKVDGPSISAYRKRETRIKRKNVTELATAGDLADAYLGHEAAPERVFATGAQSDRLRELTPGHVVTLDYPLVDADGDYVIIKRTLSYEGVDIDVSTTAQEASSV
jgi:hypothetical protein